ncbi:SDR family oxidoreductase [Candidatus Acetothermia bacterium]|jgi:3-oxoacyl-[acyl-carrier protein] reductase|nr:SDR family oxidoreductase [Candidatus Acetothermia bacterium]MCI2426141.1 SDR family oxidoreductase [Candidatus Acetothermia bacterium]MCI2426964.1 SDR family oxidoreductase [Candidatus Acetothermia bacterium]MCI2428978.1 SDR family oxidoreductase [Candidatus Acetothermia bacterium]
MRKTAVITGSTTGIGRAIAHYLAAAGFTIVLNYRQDDHSAEEAIAEIKQQAPLSLVVKADVACAAGAKNLVSTALAELGRIDLLVNNVGAFLLKKFDETTLTEWQQIIDSNLTSAFLCTQQVLPIMRRQRTGHIINIGMANAEVLRAVPNTIPYTIAKAGILIMTKSLAKTEAYYNIRVNAVNPGVITTAYDSVEIPLGRRGTVADIAATVGFLVSDQAEYITGAIINVHGGAFL